MQGASDLCSVRVPVVPWQCTIMWFKRAKRKIEGEVVMAGESFEGAVVLVTSSVRVLE